MNSFKSSKINRLGISLPTQIVDRIENERGDVSRSRFVLRLLELGFMAEEEKTK